MDNKKNSKFSKIILNLYNKLTSITNHLDFLFKNKLIDQDLYIENMYSLNDIYTKIYNLEDISSKKKLNKNESDDLLNEIYKNFEKNYIKLGAGSCKNLLEIMSRNEDLYEKLEPDFKKIINFIDNYYIILSCVKISNLEQFLLSNSLTKKDNNPIIVSLINISKNKNLLEKIEGASIIFFIDETTSFYVNGFFKQDSLGICKKILNFNDKILKIDEELEYLDVPDDFKLKYLEQISLRDFIILEPKEILALIKSDYNEFLNIKNKTLSLIIKEFIKSNLEKQRKIIILFLLSDEEYQFTAHIIFDLIIEQSFLSESQKLSDVLFNSLHWKLQKTFKASHSNFEANKKKMDSVSITNVPYESRILLLNISDSVKSKALEKLKEINGSKENSIKAQQWLDGFLKIPFNIFKNEPIIDFFKTSLSKLEKYIDMFTLKISEFVLDKMSEKNKFIYNSISQIIDEFHSNSFKSENTYSIFINYLEQIIGDLYSENTHIENTEEDLYNKGFVKFISKNVEEIKEYIKDWKNFKLKKMNYMKDVDKILEKCTYGQNDAKNQMKRIIGQWMNGTSKGQCFGLCGPPGVGKTTLCKQGFAKCLFNDTGETRPFAFLPLGGATNGSILEGHNYTYLGSTWGKIVDILMETKCMNPIIYIDELDKISKTEHGKEIISILTHITDQSQNKEFYDRYFSSIPIDLSQVLFIFSYNDKDSIDRILLDRIQEITVKSLSQQEKLVICQNYLCPEILNNVGFSSSELIFKNDILNKIINNYTHEAGVRKLNEILYDIIREINLKKIIGQEIDYPFTITEEFINVFLSSYQKINTKKISDTPQVGLVNGLYATNSGLGGITIIQVMKILSDKKFGLEKLTGNQGDVMKESMNCAMTLAWNIIPESARVKIKEGSENIGLHIHCPESATPKDGPSAGLAITTAIVSRILNIPIKNKVAMTGEVDLLGRACEIGGLYSKLQGALNAGVEIVLIPRDNEKDLDIIFRKEEEEKNNIKKSTNIKKMDSFLLLENISYKAETNKRVFRNKLEIYLVDNIYDILKYALVENDIEFSKSI